MIVITSLLLVASKIIEYLIIFTFSNNKTRAEQSLTMQVSNTQKVTVPTKNYDGGSSKMLRERTKKRLNTEKHHVLDAFSYYSIQGNRMNELLGSRPEVSRSSSEIDVMPHREPTSATSSESQPSTHPSVCRRTRISFEVHSSLLFEEIFSTNS